MVDKLPESKKSVNRNFQFKGALLDSAAPAKRRVINQLPAINQTETLQKFFGATVDQLFEPGSSKPLNGFVGRRPDYFDVKQDYYLEESTSARAFYQLEASMTTKTSDGALDGLLFYEDLVNQLRFQGALTNNHDRLFEQNYFTWCPPIDLDKFLNFREYFWLPEGGTPVELLGHCYATVADGVQVDFRIHPEHPAISEEFLRVLVDDVQVNFRYSGGDTVRVLTTPVLGSRVQVFTHSDIAVELADVKQFAWAGGVALTSNLRIVVRNDRDVTQNGRTYIVEGVGQGIQLIPDDQPDLTLPQDYTVMARGCADGNPWSRGNRWFHRSTVGAYSRADIKNIQAKRPIVEFVRDLQLFNYGNSRRLDVHLVADNIDDFVTAVGNREAASQMIDGVLVDTQYVRDHEGSLRVLVVSDRNPHVNNRVYQVVVSDNRMQLVLQADGVDPTGTPVMGETLTVREGGNYGASSLFWDGSAWTFTQHKYAANQAPLFQLYDDRGTPLQDVGRYPGSTFRGSKLFGFAQDTTGSRPDDSVLGFAVQHNERGEILFENFLHTEKYSYRTNTLETPIEGFLYHSTHDVLGNDWLNSRAASRQMVVDTMIATGGRRLFTLSQTPLANTVDDVNLVVKKNQVVLQEGIHYIRKNNQVLITDIQDGDVVEAHSYNPANRDINSPGHYEVPLNLQANPTWQQVSTASKGDLYAHFVQIMKAQQGFTGLEYAANNWRDTAQQRDFGSHIVQHSAPLLRVMLMTSNRKIDLMSAMRFAETEYARFRAKFDQKIHEFMIANRFNLNDDISMWVNAALEDLSRGLTQDFPFHLSGMAATDSRPDRNFIPPTPSYLGVYPLYRPAVQQDSSTGARVIVCHDGGRLPLYGDLRDAAILYLENAIYNSVPLEIRRQERPLFDHTQWVSGRYRAAHYSSAEFSTLLRPMFERWCVSFGIDYRVNDTFDVDDAFTWNWSSVRDSNNQPLQGHWRGIYRHYFDTDRPHTHPWEMLGFADQPEWWNNRYGSAPYTRDNTMLWQDLEQGRIHEGPRAADSDARWARPGLRHVIPVGSQGELLDPYAAGIAVNRPTATDARTEWSWGDQAPAESAWVRSYWYGFAVAQASYLMKPARFVETSWNMTATAARGAATGRGIAYADELVFGETLEDGTAYRALGIQQWVADFVVSNNQNVTTQLGDPIRSLSTQLAYKVGGFTDQQNLFVVSDNFDRVPQEDVSVDLYKSPSIREEFYGGVVVQWTGQQWRVFGFDIVDPVFRTMPVDRNGASVTINSGTNRTVKINQWAPDTYYTVNASVRYNDDYYRCLRTHTSGRTFEAEYWRQVARPEFVDANSVEYYLDAAVAGYVERIPYGSYIRTPQEMSDFLSSYERYLESRGWRFNSVIADTLETANWRIAARDFLKWVAAGELQAGAVLVLSPSLNQVNFETPHGAVQPVEQIINGVYSLLDGAGRPIIPENTSVVRADDHIAITPVGEQQIHACRLFVSEIEHAVVLNNTTIFKDVVYNPLFNIRQSRLRLQGFKTNDWKGRVDAPGFLVSSNKLIPNFEKSADDFRRLFDIEGVENNTLKDRARANTGYREKSYLSNLLMTPVNQFEFHQGAIQQKGTSTALHRILRSNFIRHNDGLSFLEEWAFRVGTYGDRAVKPSMDLVIRQKDFTSNPQMIRFNGVNQGGWDLLSWDQDHWDYLNSVETVTVNLNLSGVDVVTVTQGGTGYQSTPKVIVENDTSGVAQLEAVMDWSASTVKRISVVSGGSGFFVGDPVLVEGIGRGASAVVSSVNLRVSRVTDVKINLPRGATSAGSGYKVGETIVITGGNNQAKAKIASVDSKGGITGVTLLTGGAGYDRTAGVSFLNLNTSAVEFLEPVVSGGRLQSVSVTSPGRGYDGSTTVRFTGTGKDAECSVAISGGSVGNVLVKNAGSGFTEAPVIAFDGGDSTRPARATATVDGAAAANELQVVRFKRLNSVMIQTIDVKVLAPFGGTQPTLSVGDSVNQSRYMDSVNLARANSFRVNLVSDERVTNSEEDVVAYVRNATSRGALQVTVTFQYLPEYYKGIIQDSQTDNVIDVTDQFSKDTGDYMFRDDRWVWRHETRMPEWPTIAVAEKRKGNLPSAGYVHLDDIQWTARTWDEFLNLYSDLKAVFPATPVPGAATISYFAGSATEERVPLVFNLNKGTYRVRSFLVAINEAFPKEAVTAEDGSTRYRVPTISIGTDVDPEKYMKSTPLDVAYAYTHQVFEFIHSKDSNDSTISVFYKQPSSLALSIGSVTVTANVELLNNTVMPQDQVWVYDTGLAEWTTQRFGDSGLNVVAARAGSHYEQGAQISVNRNVFDQLRIVHDFTKPEASTNTAQDQLSKIVLDGVTQGEDEVLTGTYQVKLRNKARMYLDAADQLDRTGNVRTQYPIMDLWKDMGVVINSITVNVVRPFTTPEGRNPVLTLGTQADPTKFIRAVTHRTVLPNEAPSRPAFAYGQPILVDVWDQTLTVLESATAANVRLVRSGNIFTTPTSIRVINGGSGYAEGVAPRVTVSGPSGVTARAKMSARLVGFAVTQKGKLFTKPPVITIVGGGGTGAQARATVSPLVYPMTQPEVPTDGTPAEAPQPDLTKEPTGGNIVRVDLIAAGAGYTSTPRVLVNGDGEGAVVEPILTWYVESIEITNWGKCGWTGTGGKITIDPPVGGQGETATAQLEFTPSALQPTAIKQWRYRVTAPVDHPQFMQWIYVGKNGTGSGASFTAPTNQNNSAYWLTELAVPLSVTGEATYEVEIPEFVYAITTQTVEVKGDTGPVQVETTTASATAEANVTNGAMGVARTAKITVSNTVEGAQDLDLKTTGSKLFEFNSRMNVDDQLTVFYNPDGVGDGLVTIVVDYHYVSGFELYELNNEPAYMYQTGEGGDVFTWTTSRLINTDNLEDASRQPSDGWQVGDRVMIDDGRTQGERARAWQPGMQFDLDELALHENAVWSALQSGSGLVASITVDPLFNGALRAPIIVDSGTLYTHEPTVTVVGDGEDASVLALLAPTGVRKIKIISGGSGYKGNEVIRIDALREGQGARAVIREVRDGAITQLELVDAGWGYDAAPRVSVADDLRAPDQQAQFEVILEPTPVRALRMDGRGRGYTRATLRFSEHGMDRTQFVADQWQPAMETEAGWRTLQLVDVPRVGTQWRELRREQPKIDSSRIESAVIYNRRTNETEQTLQLYDPYKGVFPGVAHKELSYILEYDPAVYNSVASTNKEVWGASQVGQLWWDIATTRYLDYEIGETDYKWRNWGKLAPAIAVEVYEWTRSSISPDQWAQQVQARRAANVESEPNKPTGEVRGFEQNTASWVTRSEFNVELGRNETVYYFWVKNKTTVPTNPERTLSAVQVAGILQDPINSDIPWFAVIDTNKVIIGGVKQYLNDTDSVLKINWKLSDSDGNDHKQWTLMRERDERNSIDPIMWRKMRDSIVGWDGNRNHRTVSTVTKTAITGNTASLPVEDASQLLPTGEIRMGDRWISYSYIHDNTLFGIRNTGGRKFPVGTTITQQQDLADPKLVPAPWLSNTERYGNLTRPAQSWFPVAHDSLGQQRANREARRTLVDSLNAIFAREPFLDTRFEWRSIFRAQDRVPSANEYQFEAGDRFDRDQLAANGFLKPGQRVLIPSDADSLGFWTLHLYSPGNPQADSGGFVMERAQRWRMQENELWRAVDWYAEGWSAADYPVRRFATRRDRDDAGKLDITLLKGTLVRVDSQSEGDNRWSWSIYTETGWQEVAKQASTIELSSRFYDQSAKLYGFAGFNTQQIAQRDGSWELSWMLDNLQTGFLTNLERNEMFFSLVHAATSMHANTDWAFKTSFMYLAGYKEELKQSPVAFKDQIDNLLAYVEEIKPYHVKVRDFVRRLSVPVQIARVKVTDFDKPLYWDENINGGAGGHRRLDPNNPVDVNILSTQEPYRFWWDNYRKTNYNLDQWDAQWNPVRRPKITMLLDRVTCSPIVGWDPKEIPWDGTERRWRPGSETLGFDQLELLHRSEPRRYQTLVAKTTQERDTLARQSQKSVLEGGAATLFRGDIITVIRDKTNFMWTGEAWVQFHNARWDENWAGGLADRIDAHYVPEPGMKRKELSQLIRGCDFRGTVMEGGTLEQGLWDMFAWDHEAGWANEFDHYVGRDVDLNPEDATWNLNSEGVRDESPWDIAADGGEFIQPWFDGGHPDELVKLRMRNPLMITVFRAADANSASTAFRVFKDGVDQWEATFLEEEGITLAKDLQLGDRSLTLHMDGGFHMHDPNNQDPQYLAALTARVKLSRVDMKLSDSDIAQWIARSTEGVVWVGAERITYRGVVDLGEGLYALTEIQRGTGGTSQAHTVPVGTTAWDGGIMQRLPTYNSVNMQPHTVGEHEALWRAWQRVASQGKPGPERK